MFKKIGTSYKLQPNLLKQEMEHDEIWEASEHDWLPYAKNDVISTAFYYARYTLGLEEVTNFVMKNGLTLPSLANKHFESLGGENDECVHTYTDPFLRNFLCNAIKGGRCNAFNQYQISETSVEVFNIISKGLYLIGNICQISEKYFEFLSKFEKLYAI